MPNSSRKVTPPQITTAQPKLVVPRAEAREKLEAHIEKGHELANTVATSEEGMRRLDGEGDKWRDYTVRLLLTLFDNPEISTDYKVKTMRYASLDDISIPKAQEFFRDQMNNWWIKHL